MTNKPPPPPGPPPADGPSTSRSVPPPPPPPQAQPQQPPLLAPELHAIRQNTGITASNTERIAQAVRESAAAGRVPPPSVRAQSSGDQTITSIATLLRTVEGRNPDAVMAGASVVADIQAARRKMIVTYLWEGTQSFLAVALTAATIMAARHAVLYGREIPATLTNALFVVLGFYFGRTPSRPGNVNTTALTDLMTDSGHGVHGNGHTRRNRE